LGVALAGPMKGDGEGKERKKEKKPEWAKSFRMTDEKVEFQCKDNQWKSMETPKYVQDIIDSEDKEKLANLCFDEKAHIAAFNMIMKEFGDCDKSRLADLMKASQHHFYEMCLKGKGYDDCLKEVYEFPQGLMFKCAKRKDLQIMSKDETVAECATKLKKVEKCVENRAVECKKGKGLKLAKFVKSLNQKIDELLEKKNKPSRQSMTCKFVKDLVEEKKSKVKAAIKSKVKKAFKAKVKKAIKSKVKAAVKDKVKSAVKDNVKAAVKDKVKEAVENKKDKQE